MQLFVNVARILLALPFIVFGLNYFFEFMPMPEHPAKAQAFLTALNDTEFIFPIVKIIEIAAGLMLLLGRFVPFALVLLAPILIVIGGYHVFLDTAIEGQVIAVVVLGLELFLAAAYSKSFTGVLNPAARHRWSS